MATEIETKFKLYSVAKLKNKLKEIGAKFVSKHLERDIYYNNARSERCLESIRLRTIGKGGIFTIKEYLNSKEPNIYKVRNELEVAIDNAEVFNDMLSRFDFKFSFRKEKIRETYVCKGAKICIDKLPYLGYYIEIESSKRKIK
ncbi:MAG: class IV adenylate cyclase, partial [Omnitrophica bacterium]|nr:class IV adenylate cyclase [Candidatus Omnitrophota bacterium]